jgi:hypothetical protein
MRLHRPLYILSGIGILALAYAGYDYFNFNTTIIVIILFIGASNIYYAFSDPKEDMPESKFPPGYLFFKSFQQFNKDSKQAREDWKNANQKILCCPKCNIKEKMLNLFKKKDPQLMIYNEGKHRVRPSDGLHIYPMICFNCKTMTEYSSDIENHSGNAIEGIEYFKTKKVGKKEFNEALNYAKSINNNILIRKIKNLQ